MNTLIKLPDSPWALSGLAGALALGAYLATLSPGLGLVDAGVFSLAAENLGVAPSTGYPLYTLLGRLICLFPGSAEAALRLNLFSAFCAALAVVLFTRLALELGARALPALAGALLLGGSVTFWSRAVQAKMYPLHWAFWCLLFWLALKLRLSPPTQKLKFARLLALALGLSFANHGQTLLLAPSLALLLPWKDARGWLRGWPWLALFFCAGLSLYLCLPLRSAWDPLPDWGRPRDLESLWRHVSAWHLREHVAKAVDWGPQLIRAAKLWQSQLGLWLGLAAALAGLTGWARIAKTDKAAAGALALAALVQVLFCLKFNNTEVDAYFVPFYAALLLGLACCPMGRWPGPVLALALVFGPAANWARSDRKGERLAPRFSADVLEGLDKNTLLFTHSWDLLSGSCYLQAHGLRPDVTVIDTNLVYSTWYFDDLKRRFPGLFPLRAGLEEDYRAWIKRMAEGKLPPSDEAGRGRMRAAACALLRGLAEKAAAQGRPVAGLFPHSLAQGRLEEEDLAVLGEKFRPIGLCLEPGGLKRGYRAPSWDLSELLDEKRPLDEPGLDMAKNYVRGLNYAAQYLELWGRKEEAVEAARRAAELKAVLTRKFEHSTRR